MKYNWYLFFFAMVIPALWTGGYSPMPVVADTAATPAVNGTVELAKSFKPEKGAGYLADHVFCADPTAVEYQGRLYVYGTNDHQEYEYNGQGGNNSYSAIKSLVVFSTADMVNWTYHGVIDVKTIAPWIMASWAPSITSRLEADGKTHFYLYFSNSGAGTGVITATSPLGPWTDPAGRSLIDKSSPGIGDCEAPFDPGVVIDGKGAGWLAFGGGTKNRSGSEYMPGNARLVRLGPDMVSLGSKIIELKAPYHFEANELNVFGDTFVYTYNNSWAKRDQWDLAGIPAPTACSMAYMKSTNPLDPASWVYTGQYFKNPGNYGLEFSNNHTHLQKFQDKWYLFFHTLTLQKAMGVTGGYRSICVTEIQVDEAKAEIAQAKPPRSGVPAIRNLDPFTRQSGSTAWRTAGISFPEAWDSTENPVFGNPGSWIALRQADFSRKGRLMVMEILDAGMISVRLDSPGGREICRLQNQATGRNRIEAALTGEIQGVHDLYFVIIQGKPGIASWQVIQ